MAHDRSMKFGIFLPPMHKVGLDPTRALHRNLELMSHLDRLGYHEAWIGEHHSGGSELIASPEVFIAAAAMQTSHIKLGTGVSSLPYHHPLILADRIVQLDHLTRGRAMFGVGPGQLTSDAMMLGIDPLRQRPMMEESFDVIMRLFRGETVTRRTDWFSCVDARLQMRPYSDFDVAVAASASPTGSKLAGRYGVGMINVAATDPTGFERLASHWDIWNAEAQANGHVADRSAWRLMGPMFIAETEAEARKACEHGLLWVFDYLSHIVPLGEPDPDAPVPSTFDEVIDELNRSGRAVIGTPDMAIAQIERLVEQSGGFGTYLFFGADFAPSPATLRNYELFAEEVMPRFTGQLAPVQAAYDHVMTAGDRFVAATVSSQEAAARQYSQERSEQR
ncbi:MAG: LLM class flavin-dependent oxidoreductase [Acidimicrobiia bacterium]|nr:LLM class flavin-dependent oxidoreductase [Acidimicrobiia bacterium]